jgi:hypothetical protein
MPLEVTLNGLLWHNEPTADLVTQHLLDNAVRAALGDVQAIRDFADGEEAGHGAALPQPGAHHGLLTCPHRPSEPQHVVASTH